MPFLSPRSANRTPNALCLTRSRRQQAVRRRCSLCQNSLHYADVWEQGGDTAKSHFPTLLGAGSEENEGRQSIHYTGNMTKWGLFCGAAGAFAGEHRGNGERYTDCLTRVRLR